jgi:hypothetical protein
MAGFPRAFTSIRGPAASTPLSARQAVKARAVEESADRRQTRDLLKISAVLSDTRFAAAQQSRGHIVLLNFVRYDQFCYGWSEGFA